MKKLAFVLGYSGGILALVFALIMIYTVPAGFVAKTLEDIKYNMQNENVVALNEVGIYAQQDPITDYSESGLIEYSKEVAEKSGVLNDETVYEDTMVFVRGTAVHGIISAILIGVSILFALLGLIGALVCRKAPAGGGVMMLISSLVLLLGAIYTGTVLPMIAASVLLAGAGIFVFIPTGQTEKPQRAKRVKPQFQQQQYQQYPVQFTQYPQQPIPQPYQQNQYPQQPIPQQAPYEPPADPSKADVPFPDEDVQVFAQPAEPQDTKE